MPPGQTAALPIGFETSFCLAPRPLIAHAVNGLDVGRAAVGFNLAANPADGGCQGCVRPQTARLYPTAFPKAAHGSALAGDFYETGSAFCTPSGIESGGFPFKGSRLLRKVQKQPSIVVNVFSRFVVVQHGEHGFDFSAARL